MNKKIFKQRAVFTDNKHHYIHFGIHPLLASMYGCEEKDIVELKMVISDDQTLPDDNKVDSNPDYWGWFDNEKMDFTLIYPKHFLLNMCFAYGIKACEEKNEGKALRLEII